MVEISADIKGVITATLLQLSIAAACFIGFSILRPTNKAVYESKRKFAAEEKRPVAIGNLPTDWLRPVRTVDEVEILDKCGVDAVMFLRFIGIGCRILVFAMMFSIPLCVVHYYAPQIDNVPPNVTNGTISLTQLTMNNVTPGSYIFYGHAGLLYIITFVTFYLLNITWQHFLELRKIYFESHEYLNSPHNKMILFTDNPKERRTTEAFEAYLGKLGVAYRPEQILFGRDYKELPELVEEHLKVTKKFETVLAKYLKNPHNLPLKRPTHQEGGFFGLIGGKTVDSIDFYSKRLHDLERQIYSIRARRDTTFEPDSSVFVAFPDIRQAHKAAKSLATPVGKNLITSAVALTPNVKLCPKFEDILWDNVGMSAALKRSRSFLALGFQIALTIGWVSLIGLLATLSTYLFPSSGSSAGTSALIVFLQSIVAPLIGAVLNSLLPTFLRIITKAQGVLTESGVERSSLYKYFVFQLYQFFTFIAAGLIASTWKSIISGQSQNFQVIMNLLSKNFAGNSTYFITLVVVYNATCGIEIIQGAPLVMKFLQQRFFAITPRQEYESQEIAKFQYLIVYGYLLTVLLVTLCYAAVAPLIIPFGALIFCIGYITFKYQILYVYETKIESGGKWWPKVFNIIIACLLMMQITTFGSMVVTNAQDTSASGRTPNLLVIVLPILTVLFWLYINYYVKPKADYVSSRVDVTGANYQPEARFQNEILKNRLFNPAIVKLLPKVWVRKEMKVAASTLYRPEYEDVIDYAEKTNPVTAKEVKRQESERQAQRASMALQIQRNSAATLSDTGSTFDGTVLSAGNYPPEERPSHIVYMSDDGESGISQNNHSPMQQRTQPPSSYPNPQQYQQRQYPERRVMQQSSSSHSLRQQYQQADPRAAPQMVDPRYNQQARDPRANHQQRDPRYNPQQQYRPPHDGQNRQYYQRE